MNKIKMIIGSMVVIMLAVVGCKMTPEAIQVISQNSGLGAAVTWIAYDNPSIEEKNVVKKVLDIIKDGATNVQAGVTYSQILYPMIEKYVSSGKVPEQYIPMSLAGSYAALNGIDILFAMNPTWKTNQDTALTVVSSFVTGAKTGLNMGEKDPVIVQAKSMNQARSMIRSREIK